MKHRIGVWVTITGMTIVLAGIVFFEKAWAGDTSLFTRQTYDLLMRWVNFLILVAVAIKYGRKPILQFLDNQKKDITRSIEDLEAQKRLAEDQVDESRTQLSDNQERLTRIKERIIADGQNRKNQLIAEAKSDAQNMMASAKSKIEGQMKSAHADLRAELVDMAADLAAAKLPAIVTMDDQTQWIHSWLDSSEEGQPATK